MSWRLELPQVRLELSTARLLNMPLLPISSMFNDNPGRLFEDLIFGCPAFAIVAVDAGGTITRWNPGAEMLFRYSAAEAIGQPLSLILPPEARRADWLARELGRAGADGSVEEQRWLVRRDGNHIPVGQRLFATKDVNGALIGYVVWMEDRTAQLHTAEALRRCQGMVDEFLGHAVHDLKAPIHTAMGFIGLVESDLRTRLDHEAASHLGRAKRALGRLRGLVDGILDFVRLGQYQPTFNEIDLQALAIELATDLGSPQARIVVERLPRVWADASLIGRLLQNLIENALVHAGCDDLEIYISGIEEGEYWEIRVDDNGHGVAAGMSSKIFEPLVSGLSRRTGLGLTICQRIAEVHGGRIWVESSPRGGASFRFTVRRPTAPATGLE